MTETVILKIDAPLPCATLQGAEICGQPAQVAYAYPARGPRPGMWLIMPICDRCAGGSAVSDAQADQDKPRSDAVRRR